MTEKMCAKCGRNPIDEDVGECCKFYTKRGKKLFPKSIWLCEECYDKWGKIWDESQIGLLPSAGRYEQAYYELWNKWFGKGKEQVQFT